jgi:hypothetical protein
VHRDGGSLLRVGVQIGNAEKSIMGNWRMYNCSILTGLKCSGRLCRGLNSFLEELPS